MSSTNKTVTIELSQYVGTDKPTYLTDYNGDMLKIDNAIAADRDSIATAQNTADGAVQSVGTLSTTVGNLNDQINTEGTGLAARVTAQGSSIHTIQELIGNGTPTTQDKTIIGAINELAAEIVVPTVQTETLGIAETSVEFDVPTSGNNIIDFYCQGGANYTAIDDSVSGKVTLTYEAAASARTVVCVIKEVS